MLVAVAGMEASDGAPPGGIRTGGTHATEAPAPRRTFTEGDSMSRLFLTSAFLMAMLFGAVGGATAQGTATDVDIAAVGESVLASDPDALATGLETPPDDAILPEGFTNPESGVPENAEIIEQFTGAIGDIEGTVATVNHGFNTDPEVVPGLISAGILTYIVTDEEITPEDLDDFEEGASEGLGSATPEAGAEATPSAMTPQGAVERIDIGGTEAVVISVGVEQGGISVVVQIVAVPVGNTMAIGTVLIADQSAVDQDAVLGFAEALTLSGVEHIGTVAEGAQ
jgi:hypothetical protein